MMEEAIAHATDLISGGLGGYIYLKPNANGEPEEILIMDSPDINQAVHVIRMNQNGIGFSSNGYAGPFRSAWTIDGSFVADFITAGTMSANRIKGGTLTLGGGSNGNGVLEVYNGSDSLVGRMNNTGLYAIAGTIGGWTIGTSSLYNGMTSLSDTSHNGVWIGTDGIALGQGKFKVTSAGALTATNATISGTIESRSTSAYARLSSQRLEVGSYSGGTYTYTGYLQLYNSTAMRLYGASTINISAVDGVGFDIGSVGSPVSIVKASGEYNDTHMIVNAKMTCYASHLITGGSNISSCYIPLNTDATSMQHCKVVNGIIMNA